MKIRENKVATAIAVLLVVAVFTSNAISGFPYPLLRVVGQLLGYLIALELVFQAGSAVRSGLGKIRESSSVE